MIPHKCPVCEGRGQVSAAFYGESVNSLSGMVSCKSCYGTGIVWDSSIPSYPYPYIPPTIVPTYPLPYDPFNPWGPTICDTSERLIPDSAYWSN